MTAAASIIHGEPIPLRAKVAIGVLALVAALLGFLSLLSFVAAGLRAVPPIQPLSITACTPQTFQAPEADEPHRQADCQRWYDVAGQQALTTQAFPIEGQVCVDHDEPIPYEVTVAWESLTTDTRAVVLQTPLTWDPGCAEPYSFIYEFPAFLAANAEQGDSVGRWRLVGRADPVDPARFAPYQWDATGSVEFLADQRGL